jgi:hypothetical protein
VPRTDTFISIEQQSSGITLLGNDLRRVNNPVILDESVKRDAINQANNLLKN